jgi:hypothetical protein
MLGLDPRGARGMPRGKRGVLQVFQAGPRRIDKRYRDRDYKTDQYTPSVTLAWNLENGRTFRTPSQG